MLSPAVSPAAMAAIRNLHRAQTEAARSTKRLSTGLMISGPLDDAASFAIAQGIRGEIKAWQAVEQNLGFAEGAVAVAEAAAGAISNLLNDLKAKTVEYFSTPADRQSIVEADINALLDQIDLMADGAVFGGVNLVNVDQDSLVFAPPPDQGSVFTLAGGGGQTGTHALGTQAGTLQVNYTVTGRGGGQVRLVYDGRTVASAGVNPPAGSSGSLVFGYDATGPADFTVQKTGSPRISVDYNFTLTPTGLDGVVGDYRTIRSIDGSSYHVQHRSLRAEDLGLRPFLQTNLSSALGQVDAAIREVQGNLGYYSAKFREVRLSRETADRFIVAQTEGLGNIVDADIARESARLSTAQARQAFALDVLRSTQESQRSVLNLFT